jgi:hypothetical protein
MSKVASAVASAHERARGATPAIAALAIAAPLCAAALLLAAAAALTVLGAHPEVVDSGLFVGTFALLLPACLLASLFLAGSDRAAGRLPGAVFPTAAGIAALLVIARLLGDSRRGAAVLVLAGTVLLLAWEALALLGPFERLQRASARILRCPTWILVAVGSVLLLCLLIPFAPPRYVTAGHFALALAIALAIAGAYSFVRPTGRSRPLLLAADVLVVILILAAVLDLTVYTTATSPNFAFADPVSIGLTTRQYQQDAYLGAVNDVLHGRALLVDTSSQYGVGSIYLLAGLFKIAPIGYGPFGLFATFFTGLEIAIGYVIVRLVARRWWLAAAAALVAAAVVGAIHATAYAPSQGGLRFALPLAVLLFALLGLRRPAKRTPVTVGSLAVLAVATVWSIETFVFTAIVLAGVTAFFLAATSSSPRQARGVAGGALLRAAAVCLAAVGLLAIATRAFAGAWPDWGWYVDYMTAYSSGPAHLPVGAWSPVWVLGGVYFASLAGTLGMLLLRRPFVEENLLRLTALAGTSVAGLTFLVYFINRSDDSLLVLFALPAIMVVCIWLDFALDLARPSRAVRGIAVGLAAWLGAFVVVAGWPLIKGSIESSALDHAWPGGRSLRADISTIWSSPPIDPRSVAAQKLIERHFGGGEPLLFLEPDLATETLMRSRRANLLPIGFPAGHGIVPSAWLGRLRNDVEALKAGTPVLLVRHPRGPNGEPAEPVGPLFAERVFGQVHPESWLSPPAEIALRMVKRRFVLKPVAEGEDGLVVARLEPKDG